MQLLDREVSFADTLCTYIPCADEVSFADEPDPAVGVCLLLQRQCFLGLWGPNLPENKQPLQTWFIISEIHTATLNLGINLITLKF
jgi:hypothetical protein